MVRKICSGNKTNRVRRFVPGSGSRRSAGAVPIGFRASLPGMITAMGAVVVADDERSVLQWHKAGSPYKLARRKSEVILEGCSAGVWLHFRETIL